VPHYRYLNASRAVNSRADTTADPTRAVRDQGPCSNPGCVEKRPSKNTSKFHLSKDAISQIFAVQARLHEPLLQVVDSRDQDIFAPVLDPSELPVPRALLPWSCLPPGHRFLGACPPCLPHLCISFGRGPAAFQVYLSSVSLLIIIFLYDLCFDYLVLVLFISYVYVYTFTYTFCSLWGREGGGAGCGGKEFPLRTESVGSGTAVEIDGPWSMHRLWGSDTTLS
jgi:hypothetical protein